MNAFVNGLRWVAIAPLFLFGQFAVSCAAIAMRSLHDPGLALMLGGLALFSTLFYPALIDFQLRFMPDERGLLPFVVYDAFFLSGALYATWLLRASPAGGPALVALSLLLWAVASAAGRRRAAMNQTGTVKPP